MLKKVLQYALKRIEPFVYAGNKVYCPICEGSFSTFLPSGTIKRHNALCPSCRSLERQRLVWLYMQERKLLNGPVRLLHVAPETGLFTAFSRREGLEYHPVDKFDKGYRYAKGTRNVDILETGYPDNHFDAILCMHVLEHIPDDAKAMRELYRILKPGGWAILMVPIDKNREKTFEDFSVTDPEERERLFGQRDHVRWYGLDYADRLRQAGFQVSVDAYYDTFSPADFQRYGLNTQDDVYCCRK